jgi:uncharacterized protein (DUF849 family)
LADPLLITVAPNGARKGKADHLALPISPAEIAATAKACMEAGARMLHLHVRDEKGQHSLSPEHYRPAMDAVKDAVGDGLLIQITTEAVGIYSAPEQMEVVRSIKPEAASFAVRELVPEGGEAEAKDFFHWVVEEDIRPQFILYDVPDLQRFLELRDQGVIPVKRPHALFVLGRYAASGESDPADLRPFIEDWPMAFPWSVCAFGKAERTVADLAIRLGGHVRVGFENNLLTPEGETLADNAEQVAAVAQIAAQHDRSLVRADAARELFL